ncbi:hypothetical protein [Mesorhizobium sophorae]|uniref:hypothetical protein n=1 Tax=Mesorhizobium sophorae TaxID=1300294 RepID=UPI00197CBB13|nr:hypothetical protein [Mesorhizobium sophorae]
MSFDVAQALVDPRHLDEGQDLPTSPNSGLVEESSACWLDDDRIAVATSTQPKAEPEDDEPRAGLAVYDAVQRIRLQAFQLEEPAGTILALGKHFVLSLYRHPKLIDLSTGKIVHVWTELQSGLQDGSIMWGLDGDAIPPPMAFDPATKRFAIVNGETVSLIEFDGSVVGNG